MALTYRNRRTGRVVEVPEPHDVQGKKRQLHARRNLDRTDRSKKWERLTEPREIEAALAAWESRARRSGPAAPAPTPVYVVNQESPATPAPAPPTPTQGDSEPSDRPPLHGPGSSRDAWVEYAKAQGVEDADGLSKAELVERLDA